MAKRLELFYGPTGSGKTEGIIARMIYYAEKFGLKSRAIVGDGSKASYYDSGLVDAGILEVAEYTPREWPVTTLKRFSEGWWLSDPEDPLSELRPPTAEDGPFGVVGIEGIAVGANYLMGHNKGGFAYRAGQGEKIGQDSPIVIFDGDRDSTGKLVKGSGPGESYGGNPLAHFGQVQRLMLTNIERSKLLPASMVIWTTHERGSEDKVSKEILVGPEVVGGAATASLPRLFNNTWHFSTATDREKQKDDHTGKLVDVLDVEYRVYTRDHVHPDGTTSVKYKATTRGVSADELPLFLTGKPGEAVNKLYELIDGKRESRMAATKAAFEKARGLQKAA
jgi:hypothetical protein